LAYKNKEIFEEALVSFNRALTIHEKYMITNLKEEAELIQEIGCIHFNLNHFD
jgi:hypothetical protein